MKIKESGVAELQREFLNNFTKSFASYIIINGISYCIFIADIEDIGIKGFLGFLSLFWYFGLPIVLYFAMGARLIPLKNHLHNYLSVSSSFVFSAIIIIIELKMQTRGDWLYYMNVSFAPWTNLIIVWLRIIPGCFC